MNAAVDFGGNGKEGDIVVTDVESSLDGEDSDVYEGIILSSTSDAIVARLTPLE